MAVGLAIAPVTPRPDVLVDESGRLALSSKRVAKFDAGFWLRRDGSADSAPWDEDADALTCDSLGCRYVAGDGTVFALDFDSRALAEDCARSDVLVSAVPVRSRCLGPDLVIDRFDLWRDGAHAFWSQGEGRVRVDSVRERRGARPWVAERGFR